MQYVGKCSLLLPDSYMEGISLSSEAVWRRTSWNVSQESPLAWLGWRKPVERVWFPVGESSQSTHLNWKMLEVVEDYSSKAKSTGLNGVSLFWVCEGGLEKPNAWYMGVYMEQNRSCHLPALPEKPMGGVCTSFKQALPQKQSASCQWRTKLEWSKESLLLLMHCLWINKSISQQDI